MKKSTKKIVSIIILIIITLILGAVSLFFIVVKFSAVETRFKCSGEISYKGKTYSTDVYIKVNEWRWWVGLWSDSDGDVALEIPNTIHERYNHVEEVGEVLHIYRGYPNLRGQFSKLSKTLAIDIPFFGFFDGTCKKAD
ncbi:hypothetical protein KJ885_04910 [Patescibacteria group bacterium]|nr:hypothetical protein [Patescibacteria group bacterium]